MKRKSMTRKGSKKLFTKAAVKTKTLNSNVPNMRGGIRL